MVIHSSSHNHYHRMRSQLRRGFAHTVHPTGGIDATVVEDYMHGSMPHEPDKHELFLYYDTMEDARGYSCWHTSYLSALDWRSDTSAGSQNNTSLLLHINNPNFNRFPQITSSADLACTWDLPLCLHLTGKPDRLRTMRFLHTRDSTSVDVNKEQATAATPLCHVPSWRSQGRLYVINRWFTAFVFFSHVPLQHYSSTSSHKCCKHNSLTCVKLGYNNTLFSLYVIISALFIALIENVADEY